MSANANNVAVSNQSVGAVASVIMTSDVTNNTANSNNTYQHKQNYSKWHRNNYNNRKNNSGGGSGSTKGLLNNNINTNNEANNQANESIEKNENAENSQNNTQLNNNSNKKWSNNNNNKKKQTFQNNKSKTPENQKIKKNNANYSTQSSNSNDLRDDLIDTPIYALTSSSQSNRVGSKKTNLNHLLNFTYESAKESTESYYEYEKYSKQFWSTKFTKSSCFSKEQFLQANCQFVVKNTGDYAVNLSDPDLMVDWDKIEEIHIESHDNISCPICLYPPQIGKIAKCGHIFNWSCILHYLSLSDKSWRKCPICFESIYKNDLKSVRINRFSNEFKIGDEISFNLMFKSKIKNSSLVLPNTLYDTFKNDDKKSKISLNRLRSKSYSDCNKYLKLHARSAEEIYETVLQRERQELLKQLENEKNEPEVCFVYEALELLNQREANLKQEFNRPKTPPKTTDESENTQKLVSEVKITEKVDIVYTDAFEELSLHLNEIKLEEPQVICDLNGDQTEIKESVKMEEKLEDTKIQQSALNSNDLVYFYQSSDGQRIYINQLNARCLVTQYSSFSLCPDIIKGKIVAYESYFMTDENRKRFRYLSHLPLHSEFKIVELDLKEPYISQETLNLYEEEFEERRQFRMRKELREKRFADRAAAANSDQNNPHYYISSAMSEINIRNNQNNFIDYSQEFPEASSSPPTSSGASVSGSVNDSSNSEHPSGQAVSFAQMLKQPELVRKSSSNTAWPTLESTSNLATNQSTQLTSGWLNMVKLQSSQQNTKSKKYQDAPTPWGKPLLDKLTNNEEINDECEDAMPAPLYAQSFFSAIDESLKVIDSKKSSLLETEVNESLKQNQQQQKKKKKTKQLLFSTSLNI